ncbi:MAG: DNA-binding response regulator [Terriglobia bacterium]|nr:MAG: DNA-binding response regulator [Terriglobia bacterium]
MTDATTPTIRLLIVDDHVMFREGLTRMLEREGDLRIVGQCATTKEALGCLRDIDADVVLLDVDLGPERALDFISAAGNRGFQGRVLIVTAGISEQEAVQLVGAGVAGILHKQNSTEVLCNTIRQIAGGEVCLEKAYLGSLFRSVGRTHNTRAVRLTDRDRAVLRFTLQGLSNREIAERLEVSESAVKASLRQVFGKLKVRTRAQAVKVALEQYRDQL